MKSGLISLLGGLVLVSYLAAQVPAPADPPRTEGGQVPAEAKKTPLSPNSGRPGFQTTPPAGSRGVPFGARSQSVPAPGSTAQTERAPAGLPQAGALPRNFPPLPEAGAGKMLMLEVLIAETAEPLTSPTAAELLDLERKGKLKSSSRIRLLSLDNLPAFTQFGVLASKVSGHTATSRDVLPIYTSVNVGTVVQATTRLDPDGTALIQLYVEQSALQKSETPPERREPEGITRMLFQTSVRAKPGEPLVLTAGPSYGSESSSQQWAVLTVTPL